MEKMTTTELEGQSFELLPSKETMFLNFGHNWATVHATNSSLALNAATLLSHADSAAWQDITVMQSN